MIQSSVKVMTRRDFCRHNHAIRAFRALEAGDAARTEETVRRPIARLPQLLTFI